MFDFSWSEIFVIGIVALVLIGPKDMPVAVRAISRALKKMRRMAGEFQGHVDEMMRDADLGDVQSTLREFRGLNARGALNRLVDPDGGLARSFDDPFAEHAVPPVPQAPASGYVMRETTPPPRSAAPAPDFIPPASARAELPPAFVPPSATTQTSYRPERAWM